MSTIVSHVGDIEGLGRPPKTMYAVRIRVRPPEGRMKTYIYTHDRKPAAMKHLLVAQKFGQGTEVALLQAELEWKEVETC